MIKNIIFDIGNVLTDFRWREFLADKGFTPEQIERLAKATVYSEQWREYDRGCMPAEEVLELMKKNDPEIADWVERAFSECFGMVTIKDYAISWINELKEKGYRVLYLSNFSHIAHVQCAEALAFLPYMDGGILSYQDKLIKPDPAIYQLLLSRYGLAAEESVFLDDTLENVEAARALGIAGIHFTTRAAAEEELKVLGVA